MRNLELVRQTEKLKSSIAKTGSVAGGDVEMQSHWAKYLCVLIAGFLEKALAEVYSDFCRRSSSPQVANFAEGTLRRIQNPKGTKFIELASSFNETWGQELKDFIEDLGRKEAIDSIMANRHLIAHGRDSGITLVRVKEYFLKSIEVVVFLENQCK